MSASEEFLACYATAIQAAKEHARSVYPEESIGFVVNGNYVPLTNQNNDPSTHEEGNDDCKCRLCSFSASDADYMKYSGSIDMIVHSHPKGPAYPSQSDMEHQIGTDVTWVILTLNDERFGPVIVWGGKCPKEPLIGREFIHGVTDCYALIRDIYALGHDEAAKQGVDWPLLPIELQEFPRNDGWWLKGDNFYEEKPQNIGFVEVDRFDVKPGDVFLGKIHSEHLNHGGVLLNNNMVLHHLPRRLSRREPVGLWSRVAEKWIRYTGAVYA